MDTSVRERNRVSELSINSWELHMPHAVTSLGSVHGTRERQCECAAFALNTLDRERSVHRLGQPAGDGEPKAGTLFRGIERTPYLHERRKDRLQLVRRDSSTRIPYFDVPMRQRRPSSTSCPRISTNGGHRMMTAVFVSPWPFSTSQNGQGRNRTDDTRIFSPLLYQLSYLASYYPQAES